MKMSKIYRLKHLPTGLYYKPITSRGSNLSKTGKIYMTKSNGLSDNSNLFRVFTNKNGYSHNKSKDILNWIECKWHSDRLYVDTLVSDWVKEYFNE